MRIARSRWALAAALTLAALVAFTPFGGRRRRAQAAPPARPHIVVVMADDLDVHTTETMLALGFLPNLKTYLVDRGVRFTESFVTNSLCCPSRATYLTGRYSHNHSVLRNNAPHGSVAAFHEPTRDPSTVALWLQAAGYRTGHVGKYLNEYGRSPAAPEDSPLDPRYVPRGWDDWQALVDPTTYNVYNYRINDNRTLVQYGEALEEYQTAVLAARAARFITTSLAQDRPLFLTVTPLAPHIELFSMLLAPGDGYADVWRFYIRPDPRDETRKPGRWHHIFQNLPLAPQWKPSFNEDDVSDKPSSLRRPRMNPEDIAALTWQYRTRFASMLAVDDLVGAMAAALGDQLPHTILLFTSDNGFLYGEHRMSEKVVAYEESIRVPLFVAGPGVVGPRDVGVIVLNTDLAPTIAALAGIVPPAPVDGRSLVSLLGGPPPATWRQRFLVEHWGTGDAMDVPTYVAVRTGPDDAYPNRLYVEYFGDPLWPAGPTGAELYDMSPMADRHQTDSRHGDPGRIVERLGLHYHIERLRWCGTAGAPTCEAAEQ